MNRARHMDRIGLLPWWLLGSGRERTLTAGLRGRSLPLQDGSSSGVTRTPFPASARRSSSGACDAAVAGSRSPACQGAYAAGIRRQLAVGAVSKLAMQGAVAL